MLAVKIVINSLYLNSDSMSLHTGTLALAQESRETAGPDEPGPSIEEQMRMLRDKERELIEKETALKKMEEELLPLKQEIDAKMEELNSIQTSLTSFAKRLAEREEALNDARISHLVTLYSSMDPGIAATIIDKLNMETIVRILANMKGKTAGQILAMMNPEKGAIISERLSTLE